MSAEQIQPTAKITEHPVKQEGIFDHRTHIRDEATGELVAYQPSAMHAFGDQKLFERPIGSGNMFNANGDPVGRWKEAGKGHWEKISETHDASAPLRLKKVDRLEDENAALKAELAELKAEHEKKTEVKAPAAPKK